MNWHKNQKIHFFTLLEVMVSMGVFCVLMLALMQFFTAAQTVWEKTGNRTELFDSARIVNQLLFQDLTAAFYGDPEHDMTRFCFFSYTDDSSATTDPRTQLTFATFREGNAGLTEVNYLWNVTTQKFSCFTILETDATNGVSNAATNGWVTREISPNWIDTIRNTAKTEDNKSDQDNTSAILNHVLLFHVQGKDWFLKSGQIVLDPIHDDETPKDPEKHYWSEQKRPPYLVNITLAVLSPIIYEKLETMIRARLGSSANVRATIKAEFDYLRNSHDYFATADIARLDDTATFNTVVTSPPEKRMIFENTQFFKTMVTIER